jgi:UDP-N-acetyl-D-glucosamine dehydrogenase
MTERAPLEALRARLGDGCADVGVAGLGYVRLPLAVELARAGFQVTGIDLDAERVRTVRRGGSHVEDVAPDAVASW